MQTFHIHIQGVVQGVGFRPFVYKLALQKGLKGWVNNTNDGVHIEITDTETVAQNFLIQIIEQKPPLAIITHYKIYLSNYQSFSSFKIVESTSQAKPNLLITPDVALCNDCKTELYENENRRFQYAFITCTNCGPRYSIITKVPYDRPNTTMDHFEMCPTCHTEYNNPLERRHYSQTNSCPACKIEMQLVENGQTKTNFLDLNYIINQWNAGKIIAIKSIGGYILTCDATNSETIETLRKRKHRPSKPFALMYPSLEILSKDAVLHHDEIEALQHLAAPIVLLDTKNDMHSKIAIESIYKGLTKIGVMLPYTPLMEILLHTFQKPIVATSGNISNSTIIYQDDMAQKELSKIADILLMNNREITIPQDDGVIQFSSEHRQKITLRRSRGKAPIYINSQLKMPNHSVFAPGVMLKSVFGFLYQNNFYISQYLGNTESYDAQLNYKKTFEHFQNIFDIKFDKVVTDLHPDYFSTRMALEIATKDFSDVTKIQHHKAHFLSVLGEHNLICSQEKILGVIWDGTGLGDDGNIWGGEFFSYEKATIKRLWHLDEFPFILADKMPKEPRISAFALAHHLPESEEFLRPKFTKTEWRVYKKLVTQTKLKSTSMGRLFDAVSSLLFEYDIHTFEAEASLQLENKASSYYYAQKTKLEKSYLYERELPDNFVDFLLQNILIDLKIDLDKSIIAYKFHITLVDYLKKVALNFNIKKIACSGGVFQNALLVDLIIKHLSTDFTLYFQEDFSPNDEGIAFGQLVSLSQK